MLTIEQNDRLTKVGPGTPAGELMRRYWHPIAASLELDERPTKEVRLLGEDLVLFKDLKGRYGLIDRYCAHRRTDLSYGIPEEDGLRCMYHGWMYDSAGQCVAQPFEDTIHPPQGRTGSASERGAAPARSFKDSVKLKSYRVQDFAGMLWAYMGPEPAPLLPMWEPFTWKNGYVDIGIVTLPCNWLQIEENSLDPVHLEWLHGYWGVWQQRDKDRRMGQGAGGTSLYTPRPHKKIGFDVFEHGIIKRRVVGDNTEEHHDWAMGHPALFPNILFVGDMVRCNFQYRVPVDDSHTLHITWFFYKPAPGETTPPQDKIPYWNVPLHGNDGRLLADLANHQDFVAWITQGSNVDRTLEKLGASDRGIILFRNMLDEQISIVQKGGEPMNVIRDPAKNQSIALPLERLQGLMTAGTYATYIPFQAGEPVEYQAKIRRLMETWSGHVAVA